MKDQDLRYLIKQLQTLNSDREIEDFLHGILTPKELKEIPTRLRIVRMLKSGISQHHIAEALGVGIATVTRGSKEIKRGRFSTVTPLDNN